MLAFMPSIEPVARPCVAHYDVRRVAPDDMALAYPLARLCQARASLSDWQRYGASLAGKGGQVGGGILGARDTRGYFHGLCTFMPLPELAGRRLAVSHVVLAELVDSGAIITGLAGVLETLAVELDCGVIGLELPIMGSSENFAERFLAHLSPDWRARTRVYEPA